MALDRLKISYIIFVQCTIRGVCLTQKTKGVERYWKIATR